MKKVAILTITNSGMNFGNRLQNYALQEALKRENLDVYTIRSAKSICGSLFLSEVRRALKDLVKNSEKCRLYKEFEQKYIRYDPVVRYENINESSFSNKYDAFISGSDQIWNPYFHFNSDFEFAAFAPQKKRLSYAASIGVTELDENKKRWLCNNLLGMRRISVREHESAKIVAELTGQIPPCHIDPTMLIDIEDYYKLEKKPKMDIPKRYLFSYFLGYVSGEYMRLIREIAETLGLEIVKFTEDPRDMMYDIGPQNFLYLLHNADFICTDSLHGSIFSVLYKKQFAIFTRQDQEVSMNSRIQTFIRIFGLEDRLVENLKKNYLKNIDYDSVNARLAVEREKASSYLREIIDEAM